MDLRRLFLSGFTRFVATLTCALYRPESRTLFSWDIHKRLELKLFLLVAMNFPLFFRHVAVERCWFFSPVR